MRRLSTCISKAVLGRPDGIDLLGVTYGLVVNKFPTVFTGYIITSSWELDKTDHKTYVILRVGKTVAKGGVSPIPKQKGHITTQTISLSLPKIEIKNPSTITVEIYLDDQLIFSFPFYFLSSSTSPPDRFQRR